MLEIKIETDTINLEDGVQELTIKPDSSLKWSQIGKKPSGKRGEEPPVIEIPEHLRMVD